MWGGEERKDRFPVSGIPSFRFVLHSCIEVKVRLLIVVAGSLRVRYEPPFERHRSREVHSGTHPSSITAFAVVGPVLSERQRPLDQFLCGNVSVASFLLWAV